MAQYGAELPSLLCLQVTSALLFLMTSLTPQTLYLTLAVCTKIKKIYKNIRLAFWCTLLFLNVCKSTTCLKRQKNGKNKFNKGFRWDTIFVNFCPSFFSNIYVVRHNLGEGGSALGTFSQLSLVGETIDVWNICSKIVSPCRNGIFIGNIVMFPKHII